MCGLSITCYRLPVIREESKACEDPKACADPKVSEEFKVSEGSEPCDCIHFEKPPKYCDLNPIKSLNETILIPSGCTYSSKFLNGVYYLGIGVSCWKPAGFACNYIQHYDDPPTKPCPVHHAKDRPGYIEPGEADELLHEHQRVQHREIVDHVAMKDYVKYLTFDSTCRIPKRGFLGRKWDKKKWVVVVDDYHQRMQWPYISQDEWDDKLKELTSKRDLEEDLITSDRNVA